MSRHGGITDETLQLRREIGARIRAARQALGISAVRLAAEMGASNRSLMNWQSGVAMPVEATLRFIVLTGVNPRWLLTGEGTQFRRTAKRQFALLQGRRA